MSKTNGNGFKRRKMDFSRITKARQQAHEQKQAALRDQEKLGHRPSQYRGEFTDDQAYKLALLGLDDPRIADIFGVSEATLNLWKLEHPTFLQALNEGKDVADAKVAYSLYRRALGYSHPDIHVSVYKDRQTGEVEKIITPIEKHYPPDTAAAIFWLKNRQRNNWRDVVRTEGPTPTNIQNQLNVLNLDLSSLTDDELRIARSIGIAINDSNQKLLPDE